MLQQGGGTIINTASVAGLIGAHSMPAYAASKHAVVGLTRTAAVEYARKGIRVNAVCPAVIRTPMVERAIEHLPQLEHGAIQNNPSRRLGDAPRSSRGRPLARLRRRLLHHRGHPDGGRWPDGPVRRWSMVGNRNTVHSSLITDYSERPFSC
jgi:NAD(P)-dependent dehydrogenase (short-subunit alcohol dehydrogenase family)